MLFQVTWHRQHRKSGKSEVIRQVSFESFREAHAEIARGWADGHFQPGDTVVLESKHDKLAEAK